MSQEIQEVNAQLSTLETAVAELTTVLKKLTASEESDSKAIENKSDSNTEGTVNTEKDDQLESTQQQEGDAQAGDDQLPGAIGGPTDIQKEFANIRDTLNRVKLPTSYKLNETNFGVTQKDKATFTVLQKNSIH